MRSKHKGQMILTEILCLIDFSTGRVHRWCDQCPKHSWFARFNKFLEYTLTGSITFLRTALVRSLEQLGLWRCGQKVGSQTGWLCGWVGGLVGDSSLGPTASFLEMCDLRSAGNTPIVPFDPRSLFSPRLIGWDWVCLTIVTVCRFLNPEARVRILLFLFL